MCRNELHRNNKDGGHLRFNSLLREWSPACLLEALEALEGPRA